MATLKRGHMMPDPSAFQALLGELPASEFVSEYYLRLPFSGTGGAFESLLPLRAEAIVEESFAGGDLDLMVGRKGSLRATLRAVSPEEIRGYLSEGQTLGLRHIQRHHQGIGEWAERFRRDLGGEIDVHLYWTPAGQPGLGWHYDAEEVFILQLTGSKTWRIRKNTVNPWPLLDAMPTNQGYEREIMPIQSCKLTAGNWLYIPSGYWHGTEADEESISLSVGLRAPTALDILDDLRSRLVNRIEWRERLPCGGEAATTSRPELREIYAAIVERLATSLESLWKDPNLPDTLIARFHSRSDNDHEDQ